MLSEPGLVHHVDAGRAVQQRVVLRRIQSYAQTAIGARRVPRRGDVPAAVQLVMGEQGQAVAEPGQQGFPMGIHSQHARAAQRALEPFQTRKLEKHPGKFLVNQRLG